MAYTVLSDIVVPTIFDPYMQELTEVKSRLVQSGVLVRSSELDAKLAGGGLTFNVPIWRDLADDASNVSSGDAGSAITPVNVDTGSQVGIRMSRNQAWGSGDLLARVAGSDPMDVVANRVAAYWTRRLQDIVKALMVGVFADNDANDAGDYTNDITGAYSLGVTTFSAEAFIDTCHTMGDNEEDLGIVIMHNVVYSRAKKNSLIDFIPDPINPQGARIPTFLGRRVIVDDGMPVATQDYDTWIVGAGALQWGVGSPDTPTEVYRLPLDADGGGTDALVSRVEWSIHPNGHSYTGTTAAAGGPTNATTSGNLGNADCWNRIASTRKHVKIARLRTTEA